MKKYLLLTCFVFGLACVSSISLAYDFSAKTKDTMTSGYSSPLGNTMIDGFGATKKSGTSKTPTVVQKDDRDSLDKALDEISKGAEKVGEVAGAVKDVSGAIGSVLGGM